MAANIRSQQKPSTLRKHGLAAPIKAEGFNHLHINVRNLARSIRFYSEAFELKVGFIVGKDLEFMVPEANGHSLALHLVRPDECVGMSGGFQHFGFKLDVNDHDRVLAQVKKAGGKLISRGKHGGQYPYTYVADPDGCVIEL
jgi:catechol 2,3-dioxygenase-like lactoylglutathione lyase family enzyme